MNMEDWKSHQAGGSASKMASFELQKKPNDPDAFRLLGEVKYELKDYDGSVLAYKSAERVGITIYKQPLKLFCCIYKTKYESFMV